MSGDDRVYPRYSFSIKTHQLNKKPCLSCNTSSLWTLLCSACYLPGMIDYSRMQ
jgi:hypothetical protein